ncbi:permease [Nitzschia inconspicua]|uniref:Permease n=1 Tax=Nitzschia inconspicua TaxID=303405 RepID=A0A9K3PUQ5_9STRA|nr:permease [Nitzschia inconspicua]
MADNSGAIVSKSQKIESVKGYLRWAALFLGELRDGLTMINMQSAFLIVAKGYSEKQVGVLFFVFGMSQFLFQAPAGYLYDYTEQKLLWLSTAGVLTTLLTVLTALFASDDNFMLMVLIKFVQGSITSFIPPGLNSITQGIVGAVGMTQQVSINEMMNHLGTAILVAIGSVLAYFLYPSIGLLFIVSPIACVLFLFFLNKIKPDDIDHDAARGLKSEAHSDDRPSGGSVKDNYVPPGGSAEGMPQSGSVASTKKQLKNKPSFVFGLGGGDTSESGIEGSPKADTPLQVLRDPILLIFILVCFLFHLSNGTVLPLVMQTLAIGNGGVGILMSGMCISVAQVVMVMAAKICGTYSGTYGRKYLFLIGLAIVPIRCAILAALLMIKGEGDASIWWQAITLSTQILDGVGAGTFGTMYILVTSDISGGTGRFGMTLGLTTAAMSIGGTVSGYLGQALAEDYGYLRAFWILCFMSIIPAALYFFCMPETLATPNESNIPMIKEEDDEHPETYSGNVSGGEKNYVEMI